LENQLELFNGSAIVSRDPSRMEPGSRSVRADPVAESDGWMTVALFGLNLVLVGLALALLDLAPVAGVWIGAIGGALMPIGWRRADEALQARNASEDTRTST
jgi:hypothetical protein